MKVGTKILYYPPLEVKVMNIMHVDYIYTGVAQLERNIFDKLVDAEFKVHVSSKWYQDANGVHPITLVNKVTKSK